MRINNFKEKYYQALINSGAFLIRSIDEEPFTLRSGRKSYIYVDHARLANYSEAYHSLIAAMKSLLTSIYADNDFILCNVDSKLSAQMVGSLAYIINKRQMIYKSTLLTKVEKGVGNQLTGDRNWSLPVAIIDDLASGGDGTAKNVADLIKATFPRIKDIQIFVGLVRYVKLLETTFTKQTYFLHYLLSFDEVIQRMRDGLDEKQKKAIEVERKGNAENLLL